MTIYNAPTRDTEFVLKELLQFEQFREVLGFEEATEDMITAILDEAGKLASQELHASNATGDQQGCKLEDGVVTTPDGFKEAYKLFSEGGWLALAMPEEYGGQGMPHTLSFMLHEHFGAANHALFMYPALTEGAIGALLRWANDDIKQKYVPKMVSGEWTGTMNLTEPHAGSDLGLLSTKAEPNADGSYSLTGSKIFISSGEHDMADNIIHLVLARTPDAPEGSKGISLFVVPKFLVNDDGSLGDRNGLVCTNIEHKMGIHGNATCSMAFDGATGWMVGEENKGLRAMFTMMNTARMGVAIEGLAAADLAYQNAVDYAKERLQGRGLSGRTEPEKAADPIISHPDVRRMLLTMRSFVESARALTGWMALQLDISHCHPEEDTRQIADDLLGLMTPVAKAFFTDEGSRSANLAVQVYGGHGFITEHGIEQFVRDARISQIYEGTNGIQALDLVGRKLAMNGGRAVTEFFKQVDAEIKDCDDSLGSLSQPMAAALASLQKATGWLMENGLENPDNVGAGATAYLRLFAIVALGWQWLKIVKVAEAALQQDGADTDFYGSKKPVAQFFMQHFVSEHSSLLTSIEGGSDAVMALDVAQF